MQSGRRTTRPSVLARAALYYATQFGWAVFPLKPRQKVPLIPRWRDGHGCRDATCNPATIADWWTQCPEANIGVVLGRASDGIFVFDVDPRNGGDRSHLVEAFGSIPNTVEALTGGGGCHVFLRGDVASATPLPGIEVKSTGAYVVAPPSVHPFGCPYVWEASSRPDEVIVAVATAEMLETLKPKRPHAGRRAEPAHLVDPCSFVLGNAFAVEGALGPQIRPGVWVVRCPNRALHTGGRDFDTSTVIFAPFDRGGRGRFHCSHAHCAGWR